MCGRFVASRPIAEIVRLARVQEVDVPPELSAPRWNIAPQSRVLALSVSGPEARSRRLSAFHWGLIPAWAKDPSIAKRAFNARAETARDKPMFRSAVDKQRCAVVADAFYEWVAPKHPGRNQARQPWCFRAPQAKLLFLAGLWECWQPLGEPEAPSIVSCTILTTEANEVVAPIHERMPVLVADDDLDEWLSTSRLAPKEFSRLTRPAPPEMLESFPVSARLNDTRSEGPELVEPLEEQGPAPASPGDETGQQPAQLF
jgi:putative SOS response-associated peptidase YedK